MRQDAVEKGEEKGKTKDDTCSDNSRIHVIRRERGKGDNEEEEEPETKGRREE